MDFKNIALFGGMKKRLAWLTQRQETLSQNIANADSPKFKAKDVEPFKFKELIRRENSQLTMARTSSSHAEGQRRRVTEFRELEERKPFETAPAGNAVVLEEQMAKVNQTQISHQLTSQLYKKHLRMITAALGNK